MMMLDVERMNAEEISAIINMSHRADRWISDGSGGANLVWMLQVQLFCGLATSNYSAVAQGFDLMWKTVQVQSLSTMGSVWTWGILGLIIDRGEHVWYSQLFSPNRLRDLAMDITNITTATALRNYADRLVHRHFYTSDFQIHRRANWTAALKMRSMRITATEYENFENLKGEHIGDGVLNLYTRDAQYGNGEKYENIFALL
jgi:hypothetical protein